MTGGLGGQALSPQFFPRFNHTQNHRKAHLSNSMRDKAKGRGLQL